MSVTESQEYIFDEYEIIPQAMSKAAQEVLSICDRYINHMARLGRRPERITVTKNQFNAISRSVKKDLDGRNISRQPSRFKYQGVEIAPQQ